MSHLGQHESLPDPIALAEPKPGDFCCVQISGDVGKAIEVGQFLAAKLQHQPGELLNYEHAEVYAGQADTLGPFGYTYSAYPSNGQQGGLDCKRALPCPPAQLPGSLWSSGIIPLTDAQRAAIVQWCEGHVSVGYSFLDYDAIAMHALHLPVPGLKRFIATTKHMICSQYTDSALSLGGGVRVFTDQRWPGYVTPWDLADLLISRMPH